VPDYNRDESSKPTHDAATHLIIPSRSEESRSYGPDTDDRSALGGSATAPRNDKSGGNPRVSPVEPSSLIARARSGDVRARARLFTIVENGGASARVVVQTLAPEAGHACVIGITGPPGAGKSTLVARLARAVREEGKTVAVLAVDPSSPISGGAVLGDRIRMQALHGDAGAFIRSLATRGSVGGLARAAGDMVVVADALGYNVVVVETVGAGQDEAEIAGVAPTVVLVEVPHLGDDVQSIKAGILEIADIFVVNKADRDGADQAAATLRAMLSLAHSRDGWNPPVLKTSATTGDGVPRLLEAIREHQAFLARSGRRTGWPVDRAERLLVDGVRERIVSRLRTRVSTDELRGLAAEVASHRVDLDEGVERLLAVALAADSDGGE
jgi:LAO/AO transport system kinase